MRPDRDTFYMDLAKLYATRSTCNRAQVGAILVSHNRMVAAGYNGSKPGEDHCDDVGHLIRGGHCMRTIHAEENCLSQAWSLMQMPEDSTLYVSHFPCIDCAKLIVHAKERLNLNRVVYGESYNYNPLSRWLMEEAGIRVHKL